MIKVLFETALTDVRSTDVEGVGTVRYGDKGEIYKWVKNHAATTITAKAPVCYDAGSVGTSAVLQSVESPVAADLMVAAGIAMTAFAVSGGICYGWIQCEGYFRDARVTVPKSAAIGLGQELICVNGETLLSSIGASDVGTAPVYSSTFVALQAVATAAATAVGATDVYVNCL